MNREAQISIHFNTYKNLTPLKKRVKMTARWSPECLYNTSPTPEEKGADSMIESTKFFRSWRLINIYRDTRVRWIYFPTFKISHHDPVMKLAGKSLWALQTLVWKKSWPRMKSDPKTGYSEPISAKKVSWPLRKTSTNPILKIWKFEDQLCVWHRIKRPDFET